MPCWRLRCLHFVIVMLRENPMDGTTELLESDRRFLVHPLHHPEDHKAPLIVDSGVGAPASVAGDEAAPGSPRRDMTILAQPATNTAVNAPSAVSNPVMGFMARSLQQEVEGWRLDGCANAGSEDPAYCRV